jgi:hypothetical protein
MRNSNYWHQYDVEDARIVFGDISERSFAIYVNEALENIQVDGEILSITLSSPHYAIMPVRIGLKEGLRCLEDAMLKPELTIGADDGTEI